MSSSSFSLLGLHAQNTGSVIRENIALSDDMRLLVPSSLRKHAYSNILKLLQTKKENFQIKNSDIFHISAQNIDCGYSLKPPYRGGFNEYPQSMFFLAR